jgi:ABC-type amino acid transport system permease subunit
MVSKLMLGTVGAVAGALLGAAAWAAITAATNFQIGYMAVGVGILAGAGMRWLGGGRERADGIIAGIVALLGCVLGNLLTVDVQLAQHEHYPIAAMIAVSLTKPALAAELIRASFNAMDLFFYAIAVYAGYRAAMKPPTAPAATG